LRYCGVAPRRALSSRSAQGWAGTTSTGFAGLGGCSYRPTAAGYGGLTEVSRVAVPQRCRCAGSLGRTGSLFGFLACGDGRSRWVTRGGCVAVCRSPLCRAPPAAAVVAPLGARQDASPMCLGLSSWGAPVGAFFRWAPLFFKYLTLGFLILGE